jgi:5-methylcytosine-specific restriction protein A
MPDDDLPALSPDWVLVDAPPEHIQRERERARELRKSGWWQRKIQPGLCAYCEKQFLPKELTMDHIVPVARGGRSTKGNVAPSCKACNNEKKLLTPAELLLRAAKIGPGEDD